MSSDRSGTPAADLLVTAEGPLTRASKTNAEGRVTLRALTPGTYRVRVEGEGFVTLEKEVILRAGTPPNLDFALSEAPPPPPPLRRRHRRHQSRRQPASDLEPGEPRCPVAVGSDRTFARRTRSDEGRGGWLFRAQPFATRGAA